jgi:indolepyruvate ferredoxin oxidoreductase alpha subunit
MSERLSGAEAIARGLADAGIRFAYSFPGSPATKVSQTLLADGRVRHAWCTNEAVAATMALAGAALADWGTACIFKHVGVNVALDALATGGQINEYASPCLFIEGIDARPRTSQNVQDNRALWMSHARMMALEPGNPQECYDLTRWAARLSAHSGMPIVVRAEERVLSAAGEVTTAEPTLQAARRPAWTQAAPLISTAATCNFHTAKRDWLLARVEAPWALSQGPGTVGYLVAGQLGAQAVLQAPTLRLGSANPIPAATIRAFAEELDEIVVVEEGLPLLAEAVAALDLDARLGTAAPGEVQLCPSPALRLGQLPDVERGGRWPEHFAEAQTGMSGFRPGDPRLALFRGLRERLPGALVCTDPGVTGVLGIRDRLVDLKLQMGCAAPAAGALADAGMAAVAVMGDTNFYHSELPGVLDNVVAQRDVLHILVVNGKSEMTAGVRTPYLAPAALDATLAALGLALVADLGQAVTRSGPRMLVLRMETEVAADM